MSKCQINAELQALFGYAKEKNVVIICSTPNNGQLLVISPVQIGMTRVDSPTEVLRLWTDPGMIDFGNMSSLDCIEDLRSMDINEGHQCHFEIWDTIRWILYNPDNVIMTVQPTEYYEN
ncbi:hypothetical protein HQ571_04115 [Candidatus Kuenenbacteria bacterium]|nr:hypothetical protein [Candidatus Kuenenbacteria bacterium]